MFALYDPARVRCRTPGLRPQAQSHGPSRRVLVEQITAFDPQRLGDFAGRERACGLFTFYVAIDPAFLLDLASRCGFSPIATACAISSTM